MEQIIAVTHSEAFAEKAEHVIRVEKKVGEGKVAVERQPRMRLKDLEQRLALAQQVQEKGLSVQETRQRVKSF